MNASRKGKPEELFSWTLFVTVCDLQALAIPAIILRGIFSHAPNTAVTVSVGLNLLLAQGVLNAVNFCRVILEGTKLPGSLVPIFLPKFNTGGYYYDHRIKTGMHKRSAGTIH